MRGKRGQLSLELVLLMLALVVGGATVGYSTLKSGGFDANSSVVKDVAFSGFTSSGYYIKSYEIKDGKLILDVVSNNNENGEITSSITITLNNGTVIKKEYSTTLKPGENTISVDLGVNPEEVESISVSSEDINLNIDSTEINPASENTTTTKVNTTINNTTDTDNNTINKPDIVPEIDIYYSNGTHCCGHHQVRNQGEDQQLQNRFGHCKNNGKVNVVVKIWNLGNANITEPFTVIIYDNNIQNGTIKNITISASKDSPFSPGTYREYNLPYTISKNKGCGWQERHMGESQQNMEQHHGPSQGCGNVINHTIIVYADYYNSVNESNEDNNIAEVYLTIGTGQHHNNNNNYGVATNLKIINNNELKITNIRFENGEPLSGQLPGAIDGTKIYNAQDTISSSSTNINSNGILELGNLKSINNLDLTVNSNGKETVVEGLDSINTFKGTVNDVTTIKNIGEIGTLDLTDNSNGKLTIDSIGYINSMDLGCPNDNIMVKDTSIGTLNIKNANSNFQMTLDNVNIDDSLKISQNLDGKIIINNSDINKLDIIGNINGGGEIEIINSNVDGKYIKYLKITNKNEYDNLAEKGSIKELFLKMNGNSEGIFTYEPINGGSPLSGYLGEITITGGNIAKYNVDGTITSGKIKVNGNGGLEIGSLYSIDTLYIHLNGNAGDEYGVTLNVPYINTLKFISNLGFNSESGAIGRVEGNVFIRTNGSEIGQILVDVINGNGELKVENSKVDTIDIRKIDSNGLLTIENSEIGTLKIDDTLKGSNVVIKNSRVDNIRAPKKGTIKVEYSTINGQYIYYDSDYNP